MKKKIFIVNNNMHIGGVQKALVNLLGCIHNEFDITLLLFHPEGKCMKNIPENVKIISPKSAYRYLGMTKYDVEGRNLTKFVRGIFAAISRIFGRKKAIFIMSLGQEMLSSYDVAISYLHNGSDNIFYGGCNDFVLKHVDAKRKVAFLHCDYERCGANTKENARQYAQFDLIAACSDGCAKSFTKVMPELINKVVTVKNCHDFEKITKEALDDNIQLSKEYINIVTVARLGREKGVLRAIEAISKLGTFQAKIKYYVIGDGIEKNMLIDMIKQYGLEDVICFCGEMENPYGYMKAADLLLITSYSEAAPLVIDEAASLGTPILSTKTSSAEEMILKTEFGWVCENSVEGITEGLKDLLNAPEKLHKKSEYLNEYQHNNDTAVSQFESFLINR